MNSREICGFVFTLLCCWYNPVPVGATTNKTIDLSSTCKEVFGTVTYSAEKAPIYVVWNGDLIRKCRITFETKSSKDKLCLFVVENQLKTKDQDIIISTIENGLDIPFKTITPDSLSDIPHCGEIGRSLSIFMINVKYVSTKNSSITIKVVATDTSASYTTIQVATISVASFLFVVVVVSISISKGNTGEMISDSDDDCHVSTENNTYFSDLDSNNGQKYSDDSYKSS